MDKIENMSLVVTDGDLHRAFLEDYGSTECDFEVADAVQQAYMGGALVVVQALWGAATAEEPQMSVILQRLMQAKAEIERFNELRDRAIASGHTAPPAQ